jgi:hypothetical protein
MIDHDAGVEYISEIEKYHHYELDFVDDIESIEIEFLNKTSGDTVVDAQGVILDNMYISIHKLKIDSVDLLSNIDKISVYKDTHKNIHKTYAFMSFSGIIKIKIHKNLLYTNWLSQLLR